MYRLGACLGVLLLGAVGCASSGTPRGPIAAEASTRTTLVYVEGMTWPSG